MTVYFLLNEKTERLYKKPGYFSVMSYDREQDAKSAVTRLAKKTTDKYVVITSDEWESRPVKMKKVRNLMTGKEIEIADDTPLCCDPSSETYWSM